MLIPISVTPSGKNNKIIFISNRNTPIMVIQNTINARKNIVLNAASSKFIKIYIDIFFCLIS